MGADLLGVAGQGGAHRPDVLADGRGDLLDGCGGHVQLGGLGGVVDRTELLPGGVDPGAGVGELGPGTVEAAGVGGEGVHVALDHGNFRTVQADRACKLSVPVLRLIQTS